MDCHVDTNNWLDSKAQNTYFFFTSNFPSKIFLVMILTISYPQICTNHLLLGMLSPANIKSAISGVLQGETTNLCVCGVVLVASFTSCTSWLVCHVDDDSCCVTFMVQFSPCPFCNLILETGGVGSLCLTFCEELILLVDDVLSKSLFRMHNWFQMESAITCILQIIAKLLIYTAKKHQCIGDMHWMPNPLIA